MRLSIDYQKKYRLLYSQSNNVSLKTFRLPCKKLYDLGGKDDLSLILTKIIFPHLCVRTDVNPKSNKR